MTNKFILWAICTLAATGFIVKFDGEITAFKMFMIFFLISIQHLLLDILKWIRE